MDQNEGTGAQPDPNAGQDPAQAGQPPAGSGQDAAAEYAAWSGDQAYQQQPQGAEQGAYTPEPQTATYSDPAAAAPADQQAYAQQQYDQQAYAQQQQAYAQQQQQAYQQQYDQQAYAQQQYQQPAQQQGYYDQSQYGQGGYYDQSQYGQGGYYDQSQYGQQYQQQPYQQQAYQQQPTQPYAYGQPAQPWPGQEQYWEQQDTGYSRSFIAVLAGFALFTWGLVLAFGGGLVVWLGNLNEIVDNLVETTNIEITTATQDAIDEFNRNATGFGGVLLILGLTMVIGAVGIWAHRRWGRAFGIVLGLLGTIAGIGAIISSVTFEAADITIQGAFTGEAPALGFAILVTATFGLILIAMFVGRRHFKKKGVGVG